MSNLPEIKLTRGIHRDQNVIRIEFAFNPKTQDVLRQNFLVRWSKTMGCWYIPEAQFNLNTFLNIFRGIIWVNYNSLKTQDKAALKKPDIESDAKIITKVKLPEGYKELLIQKRYSLSTQKMYVSYMLDFVKEFNECKLSEITHEQINHYILRLVQEKKISASQQNQRINAIKFYYEKVLKREKQFFNIERPRKASMLPKVLSEKEILSILQESRNLKHKAILGTIYSAGLRRSELINLRIHDVDFDRHILNIRGAKGKKDRISILSDSISVILKRYLVLDKPNYWLFEGVGRKQYSTTSIAHILNSAAIKAGIDKRVTPHMLRHSFATHMLEQGVDIRHIQTILGHESSKTTEIYTHVSTKSLAKIKSPLDIILQDKT